MWFLKWFGEGGTKPAVQKVIADATIHVPMIYLPLYYMFENSMFGGSPELGLKQYKDEAWSTLTAYWQIFPLFHLVNFRYNRPELRI